MKHRFLHHSEIRIPPFKIRFPNYSIRRLQAVPQFSMRRLQIVLYLLTSLLCNPCGRQCDNQALIVLKTAVTYCSSLINRTLDVVRVPVSIAFSFTLVNSTQSAVTRAVATMGRGANATRAVVGALL